MSRVEQSLDFVISDHAPESSLEAGQSIAVGHDKINAITESNIGLVVTIAREYEGRGLESPDLVQEGCIGLIKAAGKFDEQRGFKFSTYAREWVHGEVQRAIVNKSQAIYVPEHVVYKDTGISVAVSKLNAGQAQTPDDKQIAAQAKVSVEEVVSYRERPRVAKSLNEPLRQDDSDETLEFGDLIVDRGATNEALMPVLESEKAATLKQQEYQDNTLRLVFDKILTEREQRVIKLRFGLDGEAPSTLEEIGSMYNVTRERIRQIEKQALAKLRQSEALATLVR